MAPQIVTEYSKDLSRPPQGVTINSKLHDKLLLTNDGDVLLVECFSCEGNYSHIALVRHLDFGDDGVGIVDNILLSLAEDSEDVALEKLVALEMHTTGEIIGRFVFQERSYTNNQTSSNKILQVRGAYIDESFSRVGVAPKVYQQVCENHGAVMSDNKQSILGAKLWASRIADNRTLVVYDTDIDEIVGEFTGGTKSGTDEIWATDITDQADISKLEYLIKISTGDRHGIVLIWEN